MAAKLLDPIPPGEILYEDFMKPLGVRMNALGLTRPRERLIHDSNGTRWVVDYKTSRHEGGDLEAFLDEQRRRSQARLDAYAAALGAEGRGIYLPLLSGWRSWRAADTESGRRAV